MSRIISECLSNLRSERLGGRDALLKESFFIEWEIVDSPRRLIKDYKFENYKSLSFFINEVLEYQNDVNHHSKMIIGHRSVRIETYTHDLQDITNLDEQIAREADLIYKDSRDAV